MATFRQTSDHKPAADSPVKPRLVPRLILLTLAPVTVLVVVFWLIVILAEEKMEILSLQRWLDSEARQYEQRLLLEAQRQVQNQAEYLNPGISAADDPAAIEALASEPTETPNSQAWESEFNYYRTATGVPLWLSGYQQPGFFEHQLGPEDKHFLVQPDPVSGGLFYVVFKKDADDYLDEYESELHRTVLIVGVGATLLLYLYLWYLLRQLSVPLKQVVGKIRQMSPDEPDFVLDARYQEFDQIESALLASKQRIAGYFRREQEFSHFAAHEIRTPLMVLQGSTELLQKAMVSPDTSANSLKNRARKNRALQDRALVRIQQATVDIRLLTDAFLLLGQEQIEHRHYQRCGLAELLQQQLANCVPLYDLQGLGYRLTLAAEPEVLAPPEFLIILINNLLKNAFSYGCGEVNILLDSKQLGVTNLLPQSSSSKGQGNSGYGYGLVIIERICQRLGWAFQVGSDDGMYAVSIVLTES
ncbi:sensor histidine kinase [Oceanobacter mangrovi]|uniref:sensor histidine kinase n=1 Tax=Oceanobacter mangrovi TaxID=2862510 RepID=UPI001C8D67CB|nr:HAMP domain-containing sensor histidine kinase [Oceanobacter mangrovi]